MTVMKWKLKKMELVYLTYIDDYTNFQSYAIVASMVFADSDENNV